MRQGGAAMHESNPDRDKHQEQRQVQQEQPRQRPPADQQQPSEQEEWEAGIARGEEYGESGERQRAQSDVYG
jgi:hypothetical protein